MFEMPFLFATLCGLYAAWGFLTGHKGIQVAPRNIFPARLYFNLNTGASNTVHSDGLPFEVQAQPGVH